MAKTSDKADATTNTYMRKSTLRKFSVIAEADRRSLVDTFDVMADAELTRRDIDPTNLKSTKRKVPA